MAAGKYVVFIDSDDWIESEELMDILRRIRYHPSKFLHTLSSTLSKHILAFLYISSALTTLYKTELFSSILFLK